MWWSWILHGRRFRSRAKTLQLTIDLLTMVVCTPGMSRIKTAAATVGGINLNTLQSFLIRRLRSYETFRYSKYKYLLRYVAYATTTHCSYDRTRMILTIRINSASEQTNIN
jgi:hypothetical protein